MGHVAMDGLGGSLKGFAAAGIGRKIYIHMNNTNPVLIEGSAAHRDVQAAGWEVAYDGMEIVL
jgi:pyrroloquinoline quinone biosynthesis protein B